MHSISSVRSAGGAATYFAKDDYYTGEGTAEFSAWGGKGADMLGLAGEVGKQPFQELLQGQLPDGSLVNQVEGRRMGLDLTFSMPKSASVLALVGGDSRLLEEHRQAVRETMQWVEKTHAEVRSYERSRNGEPVRSGNLVWAMFEHDTSRKLDPQSHIHVVVAAISQAANGDWRALFNGAIWSANATIGSVYHAQFREKVEALGYGTELSGKHGQFEISDVPREVSRAFSQRREEILERVAALGIATPQGQDAVVLGTRDNKTNVEDKGALYQAWQERAAALGFDAKAMVEQAAARARPDVSLSQPVQDPAVAEGIIERIRTTVGLWLHAADPLTTNGLRRLTLSPVEIRSEMAVASAIRILGQREAAFGLQEITKTALDLGLANVTILRAENRVRQLLKLGQLIPGKSERLDGVVTQVTTPEHLQQERQLLAAIDVGREQGHALFDPHESSHKLASVEPALLQNPAPLTDEQMRAATLVLSSPDRMVLVQGVAGAGKSTMIDRMARVAESEGREVLGLAFANKMVNQLRDDAGIKAQTVSSFINAHLANALRGQGPGFEASRAALAGKLLLLDEASLVANEAMVHLTTIANAFAVEKLVMVGDRHQLLPIDAGKAFVLLQSHAPSIAHMPTSLRQRSEAMKEVANLTRRGEVGKAMEVLRKQEALHEHKDDYLERSAEAWLALSPEQRERTDIYTSGRLSRATLNRLVQDGLRAEGQLTGPTINLQVTATVHATREELRYHQTYRTGQILTVTRHNAVSGLARGTYAVVGHGKGDKVRLRQENGKIVTFKPGTIDPHDRRELIQLAARESVSLQAGDRIRWTASDKERGIFNSDGARVLAVSDAGVEVELADKSTLLLAPGDRMLERLGLGYAINMHQAQGMTQDFAIGAMHSSEKHLSNARLFHVMATRVREGFELFTNDVAALTGGIARNAGDKASALEVIGEKDLKVPPSAPKQGLSEASFRAEPDKHVGPQLPLPEKSIELGL